MKKYFCIALTFILLFTFNKTSAQNTNELIGKVNGENLYLSKFNRLLNAQKRKFHKNLNFDLFSLRAPDPTNSLKRQEYLQKARSEGLSQTSDEFNKEWSKLISSSGSYESLENKAKENGLTIAEVKTKLKENITLDKYREKNTKDKILEIMINELIALQEAKQRNLEVKEEEILKRLDLIKEKQSGEEGFKTFLEENNATLEEAKSEIKNQILYELVKKELEKEKINFKAFFNKKKTQSDIIVYSDKILPKQENKTESSEPPTAQNIQNNSQPTDMRTNEYPTITKAKVEEVKKLEEKTNTIVAELEKKPEPQTLSQEKGTKPSFLKLFKVKKNEPPLLNDEQTKTLDEQIKQRHTVSIDEENEGFLKKAATEKPQIIKPIKNTLRVKIDKKKVSKTIPIKALKEKYSKFKLANAKKKKEMANRKAAKVEIKKEIVEQKIEIPIQASVSQPSKLESLSKELEELRRKIEQRRVSVK